MIKPQQLRAFPLFSKLEIESLSRIAPACGRKRWRRNQLLFNRGEPAVAFFLVEIGKIKVFRSSAEGREKVLHVVEPWQSFGEVAVLSMEAYPASAQALEETVAIAVPREPFNDLVSSDAMAARAIIAGQAEWLRRLIDQTASQVLEDVPTRLARYFVVYAATHDIVWQNGSVLSLDLKKSVIASQIGTIPETLARTIRRLCDDGLLERQGGDLVLQDAGALLELAYRDATD